MDTASLQPSSAADHLCVLVHGLWGNPKHLDFLATSLRQKYPQDKLHILVAKRNAGSFTYDGIELGGERVTKEIEETLEHHARNGVEIKKLSVVGYSLGGLVSRYAIGLLYHKGYFDKLEPVNFTTFATPHLGVRTPLVGYHNHIWNVLGARTLSMSGRQLFTIDSFRDTGRPLLAVLADPDSIFIRALARFRNRSLYANIVNDRSAVYYTTGISRIDPFVDLDAISINYVPGTSDVIISPTHHASPKTLPTALPTFSTRFTKDTRALLSRLPLILFLTVFIPIGTVIFLLNSVFQSVRSRHRIKLHEAGKAGIDIGGYRIPLIFDDVRREAEEMFEGVNALQEQEYLPAGSEEMASVPNSPTLARIDPPLPPAVKTTSTSDGSGVGEEVAESVCEQKQGERALEFPTLALTPAQFAMIQALDDVGWRKYPVFIHQHRHSHAAIIVRMNKPGFEEGKIVVKHWLGEFAV